MFLKVFEVLEGLEAHAKACYILIKARLGPRGTMVWALRELHLQEVYGKKNKV